MYLPAVFGPGGDHPVQAPAQQDRRLHHCESECAKKGQQTECCLGGAAGWGQHGGGRWSRERACSMEHLGAIGMESRLQSSCSSSGRTAGWHRWRMPKPWRRSTAGGTRSMAPQQQRWPACGRYQQRWEFKLHAGQHVVLQVVGSRAVCRHGLHLPASPFLWCST